MLSSPTQRAAVGDKGKLEYRAQQVWRDHRPHLVRRQTLPTRGREVSIRAHGTDLNSRSDSSPGGKCFRIVAQRIWLRRRRKQKFHMITEYCNVRTNRTDYGRRPLTRPHVKAFHTAQITITCVHDTNESDPAVTCAQAPSRSFTTSSSSRRRTLAEGSTLISLPLFSFSPFYPLQNTWSLRFGVGIPNEIGAYRPAFDLR